MTIETKFNVGDTVWFIHDGCAVRGEICEVQSVAGKCNFIYNSYKFIDELHGDHSHFIIKDAVFVDQYRIFKTKQELIASL